mmetsp:Transcript_1019/g.2120  ORF Transcript_1019/g.2120 Transcript_1019/m.2120 type:complete len:219 (+) Transcript_1019:4215-4871(+)
MRGWSAPSCRIFSWFARFVARLPMPMAAYRWQRKSGDESVLTSGMRAPEATIAAVWAYSAERFEMARTASRCTSTDLERRTYLRCWSTPASTIGPWFSSASARLASTPQPWCEISTSALSAKLTSTSSPPLRRMAILLGSESERLRRAAATSRWTSIESDSASCSSGWRPLSSMNWKRHLGVSESCRMAKHACKCTSTSGSLSSCTSGRRTPMRSQTR